MQILKPTSLGFKTLENLLNLNSRYRYKFNDRHRDVFFEIASRKLAKLWSSRESMDTFARAFNPYPHILDQDSVVLSKIGQEFIYVDALTGYSSVKGDYVKLAHDAVPFFDEWIRFGLMELTDFREGISLADEINTASKRNPLRVINGALIELTGLCNLDCTHCYRGGSIPEYGLPVDQIKEAIVPLLRAGIHFFSITGGEVTLRVNDLIDIVRFIGDYTLLSYSEQEKREISRVNFGKESIVDFQTYFEGLDSVGIMTNGVFPDKRMVLRKLKDIGCISLQVSLDHVDESLTDLGRGRSGVFSEVRELVAIAEELSMSINLQMLEEYNGQQYDLRKKEIWSPLSYLNGKGLVALGHTISNSLPIKTSKPFYRGMLHFNKHGEWCRAWDAPARVTISPRGEVGSCLYGHFVPIGFGNLKRNSMLHILNNIQDSLPYKLFRSKKIEELQNELYGDIFRGPFSKGCELVVLTLTYGELKEIYLRKGLTEEDAERRANYETGVLYEYIPLLKADRLKIYSQILASVEEYMRTEISV